MVEDGQQAFAILGGYDVAHGAERVDESVEHLHDRVAVLGADVGPDARVSGSDAGHVAEATRGEAQQSAMLGRTLVGQTHQGRSGEVRDMGHHRYQSVVVLGAERHHLGTQLGHRVADGGVGRVVSGGGRCEHPHGALEEISIGAVDPFLLGAGHGVSADEARVVDCSHDRGLDRTHVGDDAGGVSQGFGERRRQSPGLEWRRR